VTADRLLRLYPRAWRKQYGEEFLATIGDASSSEDAGGFGFLVSFPHGLRPEA
jgi:hypothetical protein